MALRDRSRRRRRGQTVAVELDLGPGDWAVLGVVAEGPKHGFAVAQVLAPEGPLGRIWTLPRPVVYQTLKRLLQMGLVAPRRTEHSARGPVRTVVGATPTGRAALRRWLADPVDHVRDVRSLLLLKLALIDRAGGDPVPLIVAQRQRVEEHLSALERSHDGAAGFDRVVLQWRMASSRATLEFLAVVTA